MCICIIYFHFCFTDRFCLSQPFNHHHQSKLSFSCLSSVHKFYCAVTFHSSSHKLLIFISTFLVDLTIRACTFKRVIRICMCMRHSPSFDGVSDACPFKTFILLVFCTFSGDVVELKQVMLIFLCARIWGLCWQSWENVLCLLFREVLWHAIFCEKSDGFQEGCVAPQSRDLVGGRGCFTKPLPQCYECKEIISY